MIRTTEAYRDGAAEILGRTFDCGHGVDPTTRAKLVAAVETGAYALVAGYARGRDDRTMCYPCADAAQLAEMANPDTVAVSAYVREGERTVTTWTGGTLGTIISAHRSASRGNRWGESWCMRYVTVRGLDGSWWRGQGSDAYDAVTLRRVAVA